MVEKKKSKGGVGGFLALVIAIGVGIFVATYEPPANEQIANTDTTATAQARQATIDQLAPSYCEKKQGTKVKLSDKGIADGWPGNDGSGWTNEECVTIVSKLYDNGANEKELQVVIAGNYAIGMKEMSLLYSLGSPKDINKTHLSGYTKSQYVYGDSLYIYAENGVVTSVQN